MITTQFFPNDALLRMQVTEIAKQQRLVELALLAEPNAQMNAALYAMNSQAKQLKEAVQRVNNPYWEAQAIIDAQAEASRLALEAAYPAWLKTNRARLLDSRLQHGESIHTFGGYKETAIIRQEKPTEEKAITRQEKPTEEKKKAKKENRLTSLIKKVSIEKGTTNHAAIWREIKNNHQSYCDYVISVNDDYLEWETKPKRRKKNGKVAMLSRKTFQSKISRLKKSEYLHP